MNRQTEQCHNRAPTGVLVFDNTRGAAVGGRTTGGRDTIMLVTVLGSVQILDERRHDVLVGAGPRQRSLLAALALAAHHALDTDLLIDWMWGDDLPASPRNALSLHASRLRTTLNRVWGGDRLRHEGGRYRLDLDGVDVDLEAYRAGRARAAHLHRQGGAEASLVEAGVALAWWSGRPLGGLPDTTSVRARITALEEEHLAAQCERAELALAAGCAVHVLGELTALVASNPLDERLRALHVRALHAAGRTADALAAFAAARRVLVDELGIGPGSHLQRAQREVLQGKGPRAAGGRAVGSQAAGERHPRTLPPAEGTAVSTQAPSPLPAPGGLVTWSVPPTRAATYRTTRVDRWAPSEPTRRYPAAG